MHRELILVVGETSDSKNIIEIDEGNEDTTVTTVDNLAILAKS